MIGTRRGLPRRNDNRGKMMTLSRREVLAGLVSAPLLGSLGVARGATAVSADRFDPWLEIDATAFGNNVQTISKLAGGRPILAVIKNNAYGLGLTTVAPILEPNPAITGFAVVKTDEALALREAGISKPILLLGLFADSDGPALAKQRILVAFEELRGLPKPRAPGPKRSSISTPAWAGWAFLTIGRCR